MQVETGTGWVRIADPGAVIQPGEDCRRVDRHHASCTLPEHELSGVFVDVGDGDDRVRSGGVVDGGAGDDVLAGSPLDDDLFGGKGADVLRGGAGPDHLYEASPRVPLGSGDLSRFFEFEVDPSPFDRGAVPLAPPGRGRDTYIGHWGDDTISYEARLADVTVDLVRSGRAGGARGENDAFRGVEIVLGGAGDDRLYGNRRGNLIHGGEGDDRIRGRAGADGLEGGPGRNAIYAGRGDDQVSFGRDEELPERAQCGPGSDTVSEISADDFLDDGCEMLSFLTFGPRLVGPVTSHLPLRKGSAPTVLSAMLFCAPFDRFAPCRLGLEVRVDGPGSRRGTAPPQGTLLGSAEYMWSLNEQRSVSLDLSLEGLELLRRHRSLRVRVIASGQPSELPTSYLTVLRAPEG